MKRGVLSALVFVADAPSPRDSDVLFFDTGGSRLRLRLDEPPPAIGHRPSGLKVPLANGSQILTQPLARLNYHLSTGIFNRALFKNNVRQQNNAARHGEGCIHADKEHGC